MRPHGDTRLGRVSGNPGHKFQRPPLNSRGTSLLVAGTMSTEARKGVHLLDAGTGQLRLDG
jgi:hypothetical protein